MTGAAVYLVLGLSLLLAIVLPQVTRRIALSPPMVLVALGMLIGLLPLPDGLSLEPQAHRELIHARHRVHRARVADGRGPGHRARARPAVLAVVAELVPGVAAGRGGDAAHHPRRRPPRLVGRRLAPAVALLLGAVLAPTDPVLASDVQVGEPVTDDVDEDEVDTRARTTTSGSPSPPRPGSTTGWRSPSSTSRCCCWPAASRSPTPGRGSAGTSPARSSLGVAVGLAAGWLLGRQAFRARTTRCAWPTTASRCWRWPRCWRRTAPRSSSAATASSRSSPAR